MASTRHTLPIIPAHGGLVTAGQQSMVEETQLWRAQNLSRDNSNLFTRPGISQWGQVLRAPTGDLVLRPDLSDVDVWAVDSPSDNFVAEASLGTFRLTVIPAAASTATYGLTGGNDAADEDCAARFVMRTRGLPEGSYVEVRMRSRTADDSICVRIADDGLYYYNGAWVLAHEYDFAERGYSPLEFRYIDGELSLVLHDEVVASVTDAVALAPTITDAYLEFEYQTDPAFSQHTLTIHDLQVGSGPEPFVATPVRDGIEFSTPDEFGAVRRRYLVATDNQLYLDEGLRRTWVPILDLRGETIYFAEFGRWLMIFDGGQLYAWDGGEIEHMDDAPQVRFGGEYRGRLFAAGDRRHPRRLYFTALNQPNVWFSPEDDATGEETVDEVLNAGSIDIPGVRGEIITAVYGDFYGNCVFATNRGIGRVTGSSPLSFAREFMVRGAGAGGPRCVTRVGNDLWFANSEGVITLRTVIEHGDMQASYVSGPIVDMWKALPNTPVRVDVNDLYRASMAWSPVEELVYLAFKPTGKSDVDTVYVCHVPSSSWYGPWTTQSTFVTDVVSGDPATNVVMHGRANGRVGLTDFYTNRDFGVQYQTIIGSPRYTGRSLGIAVHARPKRWRTLRLHLLPRGNWLFDLRWKVDNQRFQNKTETQNLYDRPALDEAVILDAPTAVLQSNQLTGYVEMPLDVHGRYLSFELISNFPLVIQGMELDFLIDSHAEDF